MSFVANIILLLSLSATSFANIKIQDNVSPFIAKYQKLSHKNKRANQKYILQYEHVYQHELSEIFYEGYRPSDDRFYSQEMNFYSENLPVLVKQYQKKIPEIKEVVHEVDQKYRKIFGVNLHTTIFFYTTLSQSDAVTTGNDRVGPIIALNLKTVSGYSKDDLKILLSHEFFHVLQHQVHTNLPNSDQIAENLFIEGWATYASSVVYPGQPDWKYISFFEKNNHQYLKFEADKPLIIKSILKDWNKKNKRSFEKYFMADQEYSKPFEPRSGYYLGYVAAKAIAKEQSPKAAALLSYADYKKIIKPVLRKMLIT